MTKSLLILGLGCLIVLGVYAADGIRQVIGGTDTVASLGLANLPAGVLTNNQSTATTISNNLTLSAANVSLTMTASSGTATITTGTITTSGTVDVGTSGAGAGIHWGGSFGYIWPRANGTLQLANNAADGFSALMLGGLTGAYSALVTTNTSGIAVKTATGAAFTNFFAATMNLPTNYLAANFVPISGMIRVASSNNVLYAVSDSKTNLLSDLR